MPTPDLVVAICTKDRPDELSRCLNSLADTASEVEFLVIDGGADDRAAAVCRMSDRAVTHLQVPPGLAAQRNLALEHGRRQGYAFLVFVDDDVVVEPGFVAGLRSVLLADPALAGVGAVVVDEPRVRYVPLKALFGLWSRTPGVVLPSGRNVLGHGPWGDLPRRVQWLSTCAVALRLPLTGDARFDERLAGYSYGEDLDFSWRLGQRHPLLVTPTARVRHLQSPLNRPRVRSLAHRRTVLLHAWVTENRGLGLSLPQFWWSVVGEVLLGCVQAVVGDPAARDTALGVTGGAWDVLRHGSDRGRV